MKTKRIFSLIFVLFFLVKFNIQNKEFIYAGLQNQKCELRTVYSLTIDPLQPDNIYVSIRNIKIRSMELHKSTDGGNSWHAMQNLPNKTQLDNFTRYSGTWAISPYNSKIIYAGRYKSTLASSYKSNSVNVLSGRMFMVLQFPFSNSDKMGIFSNWVRLKTCRI